MPVEKQWPKVGELKPPGWFGPMLGAAQHQDRIRSWPWWARFGHWLLVSWHCPACQAWKKG